MGGFLGGRPGRLVLRKETIEYPCYRDTLLVLQTHQIVNMSIESGLETGPPSGSASCAGISRRA